MFLEHDKRNDEKLIIKHRFGKENCIALHVSYWYVPAEFAEREKTYKEMLIYFN